MELVNRGEQKRMVGEALFLGDRGDPPARKKAVGRRSINQVSEFLERTK